MQRAAQPSVPPLAPTRADALIERARRLEAEGDSMAAAAVLRRAAKAPTHAGFALAEMGRIERARGRSEDALEIYKQALHHLADRTRLAWVYAEMGEIYFAMREDEEADYYFRRAARLDPAHAHHLERTRTDMTSLESVELHELDTADIVCLSR